MSKQISEEKLREIVKEEITNALLKHAPISGSGFPEKPAKREVGCRWGVERQYKYFDEKGTLKNLD